MEYFGAWVTLIHENKLEVENLVSDSLYTGISWQVPPCGTGSGHIDQGRDVQGTH
jgi:hypothetical protein